VSDARAGDDQGLPRLNGRGPVRTGDLSGVSRVL
jgi:hypothetical protein